jgi:hypothetical protein
MPGALTCWVVAAAGSVFWPGWAQAVSTAATPAMIKGLRKRMVMFMLLLRCCLQDGFSPPPLVPAPR